MTSMVTIDKEGTYVKGKTKMNPDIFIILLEELEERTEIPVSDEKALELATIAMDYYNGTEYWDDPDHDEAKEFFNDYEEMMEKLENAQELCGTKSM
jgi:hypothetical protein